MTESWLLMDNKFTDVENIKRNGFIDKAGAQVYPYQPEKHEELSVSKLFPHFIDVYSLGVCPTGDVLVTIDKSGQKVAVRLPKSTYMTYWGTTVVNMMIQYPDLEQFPCKLKIEYNSFLDEYTALLLSNIE